MTGAPRLAALLLAAGAAGACRAQPAVAPAPCAPVRGTLAAGATAAGLAGDYRLTLVATQGPRAGRGVAGRLHLAASDRPAQDAGGVRSPLHGSASVVLDSVGAVAPGDVASASAARPGVRVLEWQRGDGTSATPQPQVMLRLGAEANAGETGRIEGTHLSLFVDSLGPARFAGHWESAGAGRRAGGHFCAERVAAGR